MGTNTMWGTPAKLSTDANNNTVLVGADGTEYAALPLDVNGWPQVYNPDTAQLFKLVQKYYAKVKQNANSTVGLETSATVLFDTVISDTANMYQDTPGKLVIPDTAKRIRLTGNVTVLAVVATGTPTLRIAPYFTLNGSNVPISTLGVTPATISVDLAGGYTGNLGVVYDSGWIDVSTLVGAGENSCLLTIIHASTQTNGGVANSVFIAATSWFQIEVEE